MRQSGRMVTLLGGPAVAFLLIGLPLPAQAAVTAGPAISARASSHASQLSTSSLTIATPAGATIGDVLLARVANRDNTSAAITSPGWTVVGSAQSAGLVQSVVLVKVLTATAPPSFTFQVSTPSSLVASVSAFANVDPAQPIDGYGGKVNTGSGVFTTTSVVSGVGNAMAVWFGTQTFAGSDCTTARITPPSGMTEVIDQCLAATSGLTFETAYRLLGAAATRTGWVGSSSLSNTNITQAVTLRPAAQVQEANSYASPSLDIGKLWDGYTATGSRNTQLPDSLLHEPSGLAASQRNPQVQYVHSESDVHGMVAVSTADARVLGKYEVVIPQQWDWEDIATGPCPSGSCIFAGDIGRSNGKPNPPSTFAVYRIPEPNLAAGETSGTLAGDWFRYRYPDTPQNAEGLMVHPATGRIYVITKREDGKSGVYAFPATLPAPSATTVTTLTKVATLSVPLWSGSPTNTHAAKWYAQVTAASIHPAGNRFLLRTPYMVYEYRAAPGGPFESALTAAPVSLVAPSGEGQGEAIEYSPDGSAYYTLSEATAPPFTLKRVDRR